MASDVETPRHRRGRGNRRGVGGRRGRWEGLPTPLEAAHCSRVEHQRRARAARATRRGVSEAAWNWCKETSNGLAFYGLRSNSDPALTKKTGLCEPRPCPACAAAAGGAAREANRRRVDRACVSTRGYAARMVDYSRFNGICDSDEEAEEAPVSSSERLQPRRTRPPPDVLDDLEDYFRRMDERTRSDASAEAASVDRFDEPSLDKLEVCAFPSALPCSLPCSDTSSHGYTECAICLSEFEESDPCISLPCAARHLFHAECIKAHLRRSVTCPLCRVDLKAILSLRARESEREGGRESIEAGLEPASPPRGSGGTSGGYSRGGYSRGRGSPPPSSPRSHGFTRDGGVILNYDPYPAPELERPSYIPRHLRELAEFVEISYPAHGVARVWRVPRNLQDPPRAAQEPTSS